MTHRIINDITDYIFVSDPPQEADIIFIPGCPFPELPEYAAQLYKDGFSDKLLPSGNVSIVTGKFAEVRSKREIYNKEYQTECEFYTDVLLLNGVPEAAIYQEANAGFTKENAFFSRKVTDENRLYVKKAIIVCKTFHARRCLMYYQMAFPDTHFLVCPVVCSNITADNWHTFEYGIDRVMGELSRCGGQLVDEVKGFLRGLV